MVATRIVPWINVRAFGAAGDGAADDAPAIQAAIDACDPHRGGTVFLPQGVYRLARGLAINAQGTVIAGEGHAGISAGQGQGSSRIVSDPGVTALTFNSAREGAQHLTTGFGLSKLHIRAAAGATSGDGVWVRNTETFLCDEVTVSDYIGGYGLCLDGGAGNAQYADLNRFSAGDCLTGLWLKGEAPNGCRVWGGYFAGQGISPRPQSVAVRIDRGDTFRCFGSVIQGYETAFDIQSPASGHEFFGARIEFCNCGFRFGPATRSCAVYGGSISNTLLRTAGRGSVGVDIAAGARDISVMLSDIDGTAQPVVDRGLRTALRIPGVAPVSRTSFTTQALADIVLEAAESRYDGPRLDLPAGTYLLLGSATIVARTPGVRQVHAVLWDGATHYDAATTSLAPTHAQPACAKLRLSTVALIEAPATLRISVKSSAAGDLLQGAKGSELHAVRLE